MNQEVRACIRAIPSGVSIDEFSDTDSLLDAGVLDSLAIMHLVGLLEEKFALKVSIEELHPDNFDSIARIAEFVSAKMGPTGNG